ncbi:hypothetical protein BO70DRAFT_188193 [Aspergillus heteromorphus CBS 117.55]|uniref:Uncharacterized protein n=1 Tax=Aspergillus heteromorphus CBS 117.55 TaxID=1448321 RepID=A0A317UYY5_9EURO|nr:uncharacterized protein BO70DRAFT_188193 [Aspergillus heteromorphus CBS 117.55]PWY65210.1 hypothetical protein BO70DRAFT_188193 [Aspergillus heteromorphus CBS 117.55]
MPLSRLATPRRKKRDASDSVDFLNGIMRTQPSQTQQLSTPHPRRRTLPARTRPAEEISHSPTADFPDTRSSSPISSQIPPTEAPSQWFHESEPGAPGVRLPRLRRHKSPLLQYGVGEKSPSADEIYDEGADEQLDEEASERSEEEADEEADEQSEQSLVEEVEEQSEEQSDEEVDQEAVEQPDQEADEQADAHIDDPGTPRKSHQGPLSVEGLRSDVDFSSDNELTPGQRPATRKSTTSQGQDVAETNEELGEDEWVDAAEIQSATETTAPDGAAPADTVWVVIESGPASTSTTPPSKPQPTETSATKRITQPTTTSPEHDQTRATATPELDEPSETSATPTAPPSTQSRALSDTAARPDRPSSPAPVAEAPPSSTAAVAQVSPTNKHTRKRRHTQSKHHATTDEVESEPRRRKRAAPQPSSPASEDAYQPSHQGSDAAPDTTEEIVHEVELDESPWFLQASKHDGQTENWKTLTSTARQLRDRATTSHIADFGQVTGEISSCAELLRSICRGLQDGVGPSDNDVLSYGTGLEAIKEHGDACLDEVARLSRRERLEGGQPRKATRQVKDFERHVLPPLVELILISLQAYETDSSLFPEAYDCLDRTMKVLLQLCVRVGRQVQGKYVASGASSSKLQQPLKKLRKSLADDGWGGSYYSHRPQPPPPPTRGSTSSASKAGARGWTEEQEWTDDQMQALIQGLQEFQGRSIPTLQLMAILIPTGANRYYQIWSHYGKRLGRRQVREVREESEQLYDRLLPQMSRDELASHEWWLPKIQR